MQVVFILFTIFLVLAGLLVWSLSTLIGLIRSRGVPFVALNKKQLASIEKYIKLNPFDRLVDLGSGDGRVLRLFAKQGVKVLHGYDVNLWACLQAGVFNFIKGVKAKIYYKNFNQVNLKEYNIVFCYLLEGSLKRLRDKFDQELKPGTRIISYAFEIKDWRKPEIIYTNLGNKKLGRIFIYTI